MKKLFVSTVVAVSLLGASNLTAQADVNTESSTIYSENELRDALNAIQGLFTDSSFTVLAEGVNQEKIDRVHAQVSNLSIETVKATLLDQVATAQSLFNALTPTPEVLTDMLVIY